MRRYNIPTLASGLAARGVITADDVAVLRTNLFNGEEIWPHEARALFDLMQKRLPACADWNAFITEALSHYIVNELEPHGAVDEKNARFAIAMLRRDEANWSELDLKVAVAIMEDAGSAPVALQHFVLEITQQVRLSGGHWEHGTAGADVSGAAGDGSNVLQLADAVDHSAAGLRKVRAA